MKFLARPFVAALIAALIALPTLSNQFVMEERTGLILGNANITSLVKLPTLFTAAMSDKSYDAGYYRPLFSALNAIEYALFGTRPFGWHAVSLLLYALIAGLLTHFLWRLTHDHVAALAGGILFAVHPVHAEVLGGGAINQSTLLAALFTLSALFAFARILDEGPRRSSLFWLALSLLAGMLSKEEAYAIPFLLVAQAIFAPRRKPRATIAMLAVAIPIGATIAMARAHFLSPIGVTYFGNAPASVVALTMIRTASLYAQLLIAPIKLCPFYDWFIWPPQDSLSLVVLGGAAVIIVAIAAIAWSARRQPMIALGLSWTILALAPVSQIVRIIVVAAERFLFIPTFGWALVCGIGFSQLYSRASLRRPTLVIGSLVCLIYATRTVTRFPDWHDDVALNRATAHDFPETPIPLVNLSDNLLERGDREGAKKALLEAMARAPGWPVAEKRLQRLSQ